MDLSLEVVATVASAMVGLVGTFVGVGARLLISRMKTLETNHGELAKAFTDHAAAVPATYVAKEDYRPDIDEIKTGIRDLRNFLMGDQHGR